MARDTLGTELREQGRGVVGALLVLGVPALFTVETWWAGWQLPSLHLVAYAVAGLVVVLAITRNVGFRDSGDGSSGAERGTTGGSSDGGDSGTSDQGATDGRQGEQVAGKQSTWPGIVTDFFEILVQSFVAAYGFYLLFGLIELREPVTVIARLGLVEVVPLGFGAALANEVLAGDGGEAVTTTFPSNLAVAGLGAVFFAAPIAPTEEVTILAANAGWWRLAGVVVATLLVVQVTLYELEFRGQHHRLEGLGWTAQWAQSAVVYALGAAVAFGLLALFGQFAGQPVVVWVQKTVVLGFPASVGGAAARVVL